MKAEQLSKYMQLQKKKIDDAKWREGERICRDPGQEFVIQWIKENAPKFRREYTAEELITAENEVNEMLKDFENSILDINKLKKYLLDIKDKLDIAHETLKEKELVNEEK